MSVELSTTADGIFLMPRNRDRECPPRIPAVPGRPPSPVPRGMEVIDSEEFIVGEIHRRLGGRVAATRRRPGAHTDGLGHQPMNLPGRPAAANVVFNAAEQSLCRCSHQPTSSWCHPLLTSTYLILILMSPSANVWAGGFEARARREGRRGGEERACRGSGAMCGQTLHHGTNAGTGTRARGQTLED